MQVSQNAYNDDCTQIAFSTFCVSLGSSMYAGGARGIARDVFHSNSEVTSLGISVYVLGFGLGPLVFAPLSEARPHLSGLKESVA